MILAHAFGKRYELPIPLLLFVLGGALVVAASFLLVAPRQVEPSHEQRPADHMPVGRVNPVAQGAGLLLLAFLIFAGLVGSQEVAENIVPSAIWLVLWIAVPLSCGVLGDWTRALSPFATLARLADSNRLRTLAFGSPQPLGWPRWLGWWPAVVSFFVVACGELVYNLTATLPHVTACGLLAGALLSLAMGTAFGADAWLNKGELFSVLFNTWGRLGYFRFGAPGRRGFLGGLQARFDPAMSRLVFVMLLLVSVSFDGLISTPFWSGVKRHVIDLGGHTAAGTDLITMGVFLALALLTLTVFGGFATAAARLGGRIRQPRDAVAAIMPSLLPIAFGYLFAHNFQYLLVNGQLLIPLLGNPVGKEGWQWLPAPFNDRYEVNVHILSSAAYWYAAVAIIVAVHVIAVVIAHHDLARTAEDAPSARRSEYPWLAAMIGYTMISLWLLAQPLVKESSQPAKTAAAPAVAVAQR